jgi:hypothetical protein
MAQVLFQVNVEVLRRSCEPRRDTAEAFRDEVSLELELRDFF